MPNTKQLVLSCIIEVGFRKKNGELTHGSEFFNYDGTVAIFFKEFIGRTSVLFPFIKSLELIDVYGSYTKFLKIHPSISKCAKLPL